jgi:hypothetical protein
MARPAGAERRDRARAVGLDRPVAQLAPDGDGVGVNATLPSLGPAPSEAAQHRSGFETLKVAGAERERRSSADPAVPDAVGPRFDSGSMSTVRGTSRPRRSGSGDRGSKSSSSSSRWRRTISTGWPSCAAGYVPIAADEAADRWPPSGRSSPSMRSTRSCQARPSAARRSGDRACRRARGVPVVLSTLFETGVGIAAGWPGGGCLTSEAALATAPDHGPRRRNSGARPADRSLVVAEGRMRVPATEGSGGWITPDERASNGSVERIGSPQ